MSRTIRILAFATLGYLGGRALLRWARIEAASAVDTTLAPPPLAIEPRGMGRGIAAAVLLMALGLGGLALHHASALHARAERAIRLTGGDPGNAPRLMVRHGCAGCHTIPGVSGAVGTVGPPLSGIADRSYLGGVLSNTPEHLVRWIRESRKVDPRTAMPDTEAPEQDARDIAAYLYALPTGR